MKIAILDDWFDTLRRLPCFSMLRDHEVTVWTDHVEDADVLLNGRCKPFFVSSFTLP